MVGTKRAPPHITEATDLPPALKARNEKVALSVDVNKRKVCTGNICCNRIMVGQYYLKLRRIQRRSATYADYMQ